MTTAIMIYDNQFHISEIYIIIPFCYFFRYDLNLSDIGTISSGDCTTPYGIDTISSGSTTIPSGIDTTFNTPFNTPSVTPVNNISKCIEIYKDDIPLEHADIKVQLSDNNTRDMNTYINIDNNTNNYTNNNHNNINIPLNGMTHENRTLQNLTNLNTNNDIRLSPVRKTFTSRVLSLFPTKRPRFIIQR